MRDSYRSRVYTAEQAAFMNTPLGGPAHDFPAAVRFCKRVLASRWWRAAYPHIRTNNVSFKEQRGYRARAWTPCFYTGWTNQISLGRSSNKRTWLLLHELAHLGAGVEQGHGRAFCRAYLLLVRRFLGQEAARALQVQYRAAKLRYRAPRRLTAAQRKAAGARLRAVRAGLPNGQPG